MFGAAKIGYNYYAGPTITDGQINTIVAPSVFTGTVTSNQGDVNNSTNSYNMFNGTITASSTIGCNIVKVVNALGTYVSRAIYQASNAFFISDTCPNENTGETFISGYGAAATTSTVMMKLSITGTTSTTAGFRWSSSNYISQPQLALDTTNSYLYACSTTSNTILYRSTSLTNLAPNWIYSVSHGGSSLTFKGCTINSNNKLVVTGYYTDSSSRRNLVAYYFGTTGQATSVTALGIYNTTGNYPSISGNATHPIVANGTDVYICGDYIAGAATNMAIYKFSTSGATPTYTSAFIMNDATNNSNNCLTVTGTGDIITAGQRGSGTTNTVIHCFSSGGSLKWSRTISISGSNYSGLISPYAINCDTNYYYLTANARYNPGTVNDVILNFKFPIDGTIPGSGSYTITSPATATITYASVSLSTQSVSFTTATPSTLASNSLTITTQAVTMTNTATTPTITTQTI
jgi:hypothetical protein